MANIGTFTKTDNGFVGEIVTLTFRARTSAFPRNDRQQRARSEPPRLRRPSRDRRRLVQALRRGPRLHLGQAGRPELHRPGSYTNLFNDEDSHGYSLIWSRSPNSAATATEPAFESLVRAIGVGHAGIQGDLPRDAVFPAVPTLCRITLVRRSHFRSDRHRGMTVNEAFRGSQFLQPVVRSVRAAVPAGLCSTVFHPRWNTALRTSAAEVRYGTYGMCASN